MATRTSTGTCSFCGNSYGKSGMARHLKACKARAAISGDQAATTGRRPRKISGFHLVVEGLGMPEYWMHLEVPANQQLLDLGRLPQRYLAGVLRPFERIRHRKSKLCLGANGGI